jgi:hypothetical protein
MNGDFSRVTFNPRKHYIGVYEQQGRPRDSADSNEAQDIENYRVETEAVDVIGPSGAPKVNPGFELSVDGAGELVIGAGHMYVDGILCENDAAVTYPAQPDLPDAPALSLGNASVGLVYLDVFKRHLTYLDRDDMRDVALNGVDTTTRLQTVWQVKLLPLPSLNVPGGALATLSGLASQVEDLNAQIAAATNPTTRDNLIRQRDSVQRQLTRTAAQVGIRCDGQYDEWDAVTAQPTGGLEVTTVPGGTAADPCDVPPGGGYTRGENQFYLIKVHEVPAGGGRNGATFVWSRDGGSVAARIEAVGNATSGSASGTVFDVNAVQRDDYLGIFNNDWVEYIDDGHVLNGTPGVLAQVTNADANLNRITLDRSLTVNLDRHPILRKWDQTGASATDSGVAMNTTNAPIALEGGLQVQFADGTYQSGDYWHFAARAITGTTDFPAGVQPPAGVQHHYARLGMVALGVVGGEERLQVLVDCRDLFPPLTAITASDVSFDNAACNLPDVTTVQEAIDALCARSGGGGTCTLSVAPGAGWQDVFNQIPSGGDAEICFGVGDYPLDAPVIVEGKRHLKLSGAGFGTRILAQKAESALIFRNCGNVIVRDLSAVTGAAGAGGQIGSLQGTLTFENCVSAALDTVALRCAADVVRSAACLRVANDSKIADLHAVRGTVDVQNSRFDVGSSQIGALIINGARVHFENDVIQCIDGRRAGQRIADGLRENLALRAEVRRTILADVQEGRATGNDRESLQVGQVVVNFRTDPRLRELKFFPQLLQLFSPEKVRDLRSAEAYLEDAVDNVLMQPGIISTFVPYFERMVAQDLPALYQGIIIGGEEAEEVRLINNTIVEALQGIHIGQSRRGQAENERLKSTVVNIHGNTVYSRITPAVNREAYGIYVGNCDSLVIENNWLKHETLESTQHLFMTGVFVQGTMGKRIIVRHNEIANYTLGVFIDPQSVAPLPAPPLWMVVDNVATVQTTSNAVQVVNNVP